jgi:DNA-binding LytR/AlgR family response regulator
MNTKITALIADDEEAPRAQLRAALRSAWPELEIVAEAVNGADAWDAFLEFEPQVCLLDIRMPGLSGIDVARRIDGRAQTVFVTAFGDHALAAFDAGAVDYVLKPVDGERLARALARVRERLAQAGASATSAAAMTNTPAAADATAAAARMQALLERLSGELRRPPALDVIQAAVGREVRMIRVDDVIYFESDTRYTRVVYRTPEGADGEALIRTPLKELLTQIDGQRFWQVHRSVIVNQQQINAAVRVDEGNMHLTLRGRDERLPVSRHFQGLFKGQ